MRCDRLIPKDRKEKLHSSLTSDETSKLEVLLAVARIKGALLSAEDVDELTGLLTSRSDLDSIWKAPSLDSRYGLRESFVVNKDWDNGEIAADTVEDSNQRRARAERYIAHAGEFSLFSGKRWVRVLSVAGSASYESASENDDVDIFCITEQDSLWIYLTKALILARVFRIVRPESPRFCFSCAFDEQYAVKLFSAPNDALFARDALTIKTLQGSSFYDSLLRRGQWISDYFPKLHQTRKALQVDTQKGNGVSPSTLGRKVLNRFLFLTVGNYVKVKSILLNRRLRKWGIVDSFFTVESSCDHCVFESQGYRNLRRVYSKFKPYSAKHP
jgi:hypothetical protein